MQATFFRNSIRIPAGGAILALALSSAQPAQAALELPRPSPKASLTQQVGLTEVSVRYSRPGVKGRPIWGDLVPYDEVWRTGANEATAITFSEDVKINGQPLPKGTYSLHTIPRRDEWTLIFNKSAEQWGSYSYDAAQDALRVNVKPRASEMTEWFTIELPSLALATAEVVLRWEKIAVPFTIETDTVARSSTNITKALEDLKTDRWRVPFRAADFALQQKNLAQALTWVNESIQVEPTYLNQNLKARILAEQGNKAEAAATMEFAIATAKAAKMPETVWKPAEKMLAGWRAAK